MITDAPDDTQYPTLVQQGQAAMQQGAHAMWALGRLAAQVQTVYGQNLLQRYADDIGCSYQTLRRCRVTFAAWTGMQNEPHGSIVDSGPFAVCRALAPLPNRVQLLAADPHMTEATALEHARNWRGAARLPTGDAHRLYTLLRHQRLWQLLDATLGNHEDAGDLRAVIVNHIGLLIERLQAVQQALLQQVAEPSLSPPPAQPGSNKPRRKSTNARRRRHK